MKRVRIKKSILIAGVIILNAYLCLLGAVQVNVKFYPEGSLPKEYEKLYLDKAGEGDCTVIILEGWPSNSRILMTQNELLIRKQIKKGIMNPGPSETPTTIVSSLGFFPGVPISITYEDFFTNLTESITIVPKRIYAQSPIDNAWVEARLTQTHPEIYDIVLEDFGKDEELLFRSISYDEQVTNKLQCNKDLTIKYMPRVANKMGGIARLTFTRSSGEELKLELPWGFEFIKYIQFYDQNGKPKSVVDVAEFLEGDPKVAEYFDSKR